MSSTDSARRTGPTSGGSARGASGLLVGDDLDAPPPPERAPSGLGARRSTFTPSAAFATTRDDGAAASRPWRPGSSSRPGAVRQLDLDLLGPVASRVMRNPDTDPAAARRATLSGRQSVPYRSADARAQAFAAPSGRVGEGASKPLGMGTGKPPPWACAPVGMLATLLARPRPTRRRRATKKGGPIPSGSRVLAREHGVGRPLHQRRLTKLGIATGVDRPSYGKGTMRA